MKASHPATCDESHAYRLKRVELGRGVALDVILVHQYTSTWYKGMGL